VFFSRSLVVQPGLCLRLGSSAIGEHDWVGCRTALAPDVRVLSFTLGISLLTGILFGLVPAFQTLKVRVASALKDSARSTAESSRFAWARADCRASSYLSACALCREPSSSQFAEIDDAGFWIFRDHLVVARLDPTSAGYNAEKMKVLAEQLSARLAATPGIRSVTYSLNGLFAHSESGEAILVPGFKSATFVIGFPWKITLARTTSKLSASLFSRERY
jgi:hypothetical protein